MYSKKSHIVETNELALSILDGKALNESKLDEAPKGWDTWSDKRQQAYLEKHPNVRAPVKSGSSTAKPKSDVKKDRPVGASSGKSDPKAATVDKSGLQSGDTKSSRIDIKSRVSMTSIADNELKNVEWESQVSPKGHLHISADTDTHADSGEQADQITDFAEKLYASTKRSGHDMFIHYDGSWQKFTPELDNGEYSSEPSASFAVTPSGEAPEDMEFDDEDPSYNSGGDPYEGMDDEDDEGEEDDED